MSENGTKNISNKVLNSAESEIALKVTDLCRRQGRFELKDISFALEKGYIMGLVGRMGSGKSTLLKCILNPALIKSGSVSYEGKAGFIMEDAPFLPVGNCLSAGRQAQGRSGRKRTMAVFP